MKEFKDGVKSEATFDLTAVYGENMKNATRRFAKEDNRSILIEDHLIILTIKSLITRDTEG